MPDSAPPRATFAPIAAIAVLSITSGLPLRWGPWYIAAAGLTAVAIAALRSRHRSTPLANEAICSLLLIGSINLAYAAYALTHTGIFGPLNRLAYPFLVATGLRVNGGACLLILCALVSVMPLAFRDALESSASERAVLGANPRVDELRNRVLPGAHLDPH